MRGRGFRVVTAALMATGVVLGGCGDGEPGTAARPLPHMDVSLRGEAPSYPSVANETARQTLRRARAHFAGRPQLLRTLARAEAACRRTDAARLARRFGSTPDPLSLGAGYARRMSGDAGQVAALGCYLGATRRGAR